jgi:ribonuclease HI
MIQVFTDGGSRGNPGPGALGVYIAKNNQELVSFGKALGHTTNNVAEYSAAVAALSWLLEHEAVLSDEKEIFFFADSQLLISQITGIYKIKNATLRDLLFTIRRLEAELKKPIHYRHIPREQNKLADRQVNLALDNHTQLS